MKKTLLIALLALCTLAGQAKGKTIVWNYPATADNPHVEWGASITQMEIKCVEFSEDETCVTIHAEICPYYSMTFSAKSYLAVDGKHYGLKSCDGIELEKEICIKELDGRDIIFHFEPLPLDTKRFDYVGGDSGVVFRILGIEDAKVRAARLFDSNWRNCETGNWEIGFFEDVAIYDCQYWNYKKKEQKGDGYQMVLENEGKEIAVNVGKNKNGKRIIDIDGKKMKCDFISSVTLPDYPTKDTVTWFKDTHYVPDSVTVKGWMKNAPEWLKKEYGKITVTPIEVLGQRDEKAMNACGVMPFSFEVKVDSQGRFITKFPLQNSNLVHMGAEIVLEPGETYFLLLDFKEGHKLFMGKNCRFQNEVLAHPLVWLRSQLNLDADEAAFTEFVKNIKQEKADCLARLEQMVKAHPTVSDRFIKYQKGLYNMSEGSRMSDCENYSMLHKLPDGYMNYLTENYWQPFMLPVSINPYFYWLKNYLGLKRNEMFAVNGHYTMPESLILKYYKDAGMLSITDEELAEIQHHFEWLEDYEKAEDKQKEAEKESAHLRRYFEIMNRQDVNNIIKEESMPWNCFFYINLAVLESLDCDDELRQLIVNWWLMDLLEQKNMPLNKMQLYILDKYVTIPEAKAVVMAEHEKYEEMQKDAGFGFISGMKTAEDVANMSDGETILRKLLEPYKGKLVLIDIWGTWCGPCKEALSHSQEEYERLKDYDMVYLYFANRSPQKQLENVIKINKVEGENVLHYNLPPEQQNAIEEFLKVNAFPTFRLVDREGNILDVDADPRDLDRLVNIIERVK